MDRELPGVDGLARFETTCWSRILTARDPESSRAEEALAELCRAYWYPLYAFIRRKGYAPEEAADLTQDLFAGLLERDDLRSVEPALGRFRTFLLACCCHLLANRRARANRLKRGGGRGFVSIDAAEAEARYHLEPAGGLTPEQLFDRRWALTLLADALEGVRLDYADAGKAALFDRLKPALMGEPLDAPYAAIAAELGSTEGAIQVAVHRLRARYREAIRERIARTVDSPDRVEDEIGDLFRALGAG